MVHPRSTFGAAPRALAASGPTTGTWRIDGPAGVLQVLIDAPAHAPQGLALVAHPQPLLGGSATHKVPQVLARAMRDAGWLAARPDFRGVGGSAGAHDHGLGEADDLLAVAARLREAAPGLPLALIGFSFGAFVLTRVAARLAAAGVPAACLVLAGVPAGDVRGQRHYDTGAVPAGTLVVHGEFDEAVALRAVFDWARPQALPVTVVPGADHAFTGKLPILRALVVHHVRCATTAMKPPPGHLRAR